MKQIRMQPQASPLAETKDLRSRSLERAYVEVNGLETRESDGRSKKYNRKQIGIRVNPYLFHLPGVHSVLDFMPP